MVAVLVCSTATVMSDISKDLPVIDLDILLSHDRGSEAVIKECRKVSSWPSEY
jgi:hypothetical protein